MELAFNGFRLEALAWELSFWGSFAWKFSFGKIVWGLWLGMVSLGSLALDLRLFGLGSWDWNLRLGLYGLGKLGS